MTISKNSNSFYNLKNVGFLNFKVRLEVQFQNNLMYFLWNLYSICIGSFQFELEGGPNFTFLSKFSSEDTFIVYAIIFSSFNLNNPFWRIRTNPRSHYKQVFLYEGGKIIIIP